MTVRRRKGFYAVLHARLQAIGAGADPEKALDITEAWIRGEISWVEAVRRLRELEEKAKTKRSN